MSGPDVSTMESITCKASRVTLSPAARKITHSAEGSSPRLMRRVSGAIVSCLEPTTSHACLEKPSLRIDLAVAASACAEAPLPFVTKRNRDNYLANRFLSSIRSPFGMLR